MVREENDAASRQTYFTRGIPAKAVASRAANRAAGSHATGTIGTRGGADREWEETAGWRGQGDFDPCGSAT